MDSLGIEYSTVINISFSQRVLELPSGNTRAALEDIPSTFGGIRQVFQLLKQEYGFYTLDKRFPKSKWGDQQRRNIRTGEIVDIPDFSQTFVITFAKPVPVGTVVARLQAIGAVEYAEGPEKMYGTATPNDFFFHEWFQSQNPNVGQWELSRVQAERAWDLTKGTGITIAVTEDWQTSNCDISTPHPDLDGRLSNGAVNDCYETGPPSHMHGIAVASVAGAKTNDFYGLASLGWDVMLEGYRWGADGIEAIISDANTARACYELKC